MDFAGPFSNKDTALVFRDQYVRYPVVEFTTSTSEDSVIPLLTRVFNRYRIPEEIESDLGPIQWIEIFKLCSGTEIQTLKGHSCLG